MARSVVHTGKLALLMMPCGVSLVVEYQCTHTCSGSRGLPLHMWVLQCLIVVVLAFVRCRSLR